MAVNYRCDGMSPRVGGSVPATPISMQPSGKTRLLKERRNLRSRPGFRRTCFNSARRSIYRERRSSTNRCTTPLDCLVGVFPVMPAWIYVWRGTLASGPKSAWWGRTCFDRGPWSMAIPLPSSEPKRCGAFSARLHGGFDRVTGLPMLTPLKFAIALGATFILGLPGQINEYQVKALFLYNFARYVEWPTETFKATNDPIVICILGQNPFGGALEQAVAGKVVEGRAFAVRQLSDIQLGSNCHILFVNSSEKRRFRSMAGRLKGSAVLSVGETPGFTADGGVINFKLEDGKVRFEIDVEAAGREHLRISSKLLSLAQIAKKSEDGK